MMWKPLTWKPQKTLSQTVKSSTLRCVASVAFVMISAKLGDVSTHIAYTVLMVVDVYCVCVCERDRQRQKREKEMVGEGVGMTRRRNTERTGKVQL